MEPSIYDLMGSSLVEMPQEWDIWDLQSKKQWACRAKKDWQYGVNLLYEIFLLEDTRVDQPRADGIVLVGDQEDAPVAELLGPHEYHNDELQERVAFEVGRQMQPVIRAVDEVKRQNAEQSTIIAMQVNKLDTFDRWRRALWGNGSGPPGYLEVARQEDKAKIDRLFALVEGLRDAKNESAGAAKLQAEIDANKIKIEALNDSKRTNKLTRVKTWIAIALTLGGAYIIDLVKPVIQHVLAHMVGK